MAALPHQVIPVLRNTAPTLPHLLPPLPAHTVGSVDQADHPLTVPIRPAIPLHLQVTYLPTHRAIPLPAVPVTAHIHLFLLIVMAHLLAHLGLLNQPPRILVTVTF